VFEHNTKKEIRGMIKSLLKLAGPDFPHVKVFLSLRKGAKKREYKIRTCDGTDLSDYHVVAMGNRYFGPAWLLLLQLNLAYYEKKKTKSIKYEPLAMVTAVVLLHLRGDVKTIREADELVSEVTNVDTDTIKSYRSQSRYKQRAKYFGEVLLDKNNEWKLPQNPKKTVKHILSLFNGNHMLYSSTGDD